MAVSLVYIPSREIVNFCKENPIDWGNKDLAKIGGIGDRAGMPPVASVEVFLDLYHVKKSLFKQEEYFEHCLNLWASVDPEWVYSLDDQPGRPINSPSFISYPSFKDGLRAKAYRNFYPSMIDSLHVWAMMVESKWFKVCYLDSCDDATGKSDITAIDRNGNEYKFALLIGSKSGINSLKYKKGQRSGYGTSNIVYMPLPIERPAYPGNKRWYCADDIVCAIREQKIAI